MKEPLAKRMRPETIDEILGQKQLVGENAVIRKCLEKQTFFSEKIAKKRKTWYNRYDVAFRVNARHDA